MRMGRALPLRGDMMKTLWLRLVVLALATIVTACGGSDDDRISEPPAGGERGLFDEYADPAGWGPYAVGVTTLYPADPARYERWGRMDRVLPLEIWYPSTGAGGCPNTVGDMLGTTPMWAERLLRLVWGDQYQPIFWMTTGALRDAEIYDPPEPFPIFLHSHGYAAVRFQNYRVCERLASHGFVVISPDHYSNALVTNPPGEPFVLLNPLDSLDAFEDRLEDVEFLYEFLDQLNADPAGPWRGKLDLGRFAIGGHSYGGGTALLAGLTLPYVDAIAPANAFWIDPGEGELDMPFFALTGDRDSIVTGSNPIVQEAFARSPSTRKVLLHMPTGTHYSVTDACLLVPDLFYKAMNCYDDTLAFDLGGEIYGAYQTAFLRAVLTGDERYADYLRVNAYPDVLELTTVWE